MYKQVGIFELFLIVFSTMLEKRSNLSESPYIHK